LGWYHGWMMPARSALADAARGIVLLVLLGLLGGATLRVSGRQTEARSFTRPLEFDFVQWTVDALSVKFAQYGLDSAGY
jgi:hypothetical protein